jgi:hypothetical protein
MVQQKNPAIIKASMLSKARSNVPLVSGELTTKEVVGFPVWEVFTQKKETNAHVQTVAQKKHLARLANPHVGEHWFLSSG